MFVDASAIVAILTGEPEADALTDALESAGRPLTSAVAVFEAVLGLRRKRHASVTEARADVREFLEVAGIRTVSLGPEDADADAALVAFARYGKGRGHPAQLNMADCFAYAAAKNNGASLMFKGDDFGKTDIESAISTG